MKKNCSLFLLLILLSGCDDGNVLVENVGLETASMKECNANRLLYKFNSTNSLALDLDETNYTTTFSNIVGDKVEIPINNTTAKLIYRTYNGTVNDDNICGTTLNPFPSINQQWMGVNGFISVITTMNKSIDETTGATKILNYRHSINFKTIGWQKPDGFIQETEVRPFGNLITPIANNLPFAFVKDDLKQLICSPTNKTLVNIKSNEAIVLRLDTTTYSSLFPTTTAVGNRSASLSETNQLSYNLFAGLVNETYFCTFPIPDLPLNIEKWSFVLKPNTTPGTIEVRTSLLGTTQVTHKVILKNAVLEQGTSNFSLGNEYELGSFIAPRN